jgi:hypothetical protein
MRSEVEPVAHYVVCFFSLSATKLLNNAAGGIDEETAEEVSTVQWFQTL